MMDCLVILGLVEKIKYLKPTRAGNKRFAQVSDKCSIVIQIQRGVTEGGVWPIVSHNLFNYTEIVIRCVNRPQMSLYNVDSICATLGTRAMLHC